MPLQRIIETMKMSAIREVWAQLTQGKRFDEQLFAQKILEDCGEDGIDIGAEQLVDLLQGRECDNFVDVLWAFGEVMQYFAAEPVNDAEQYVRAVFVAHVLAQGSKERLTEWAMHFEPICRFLCFPSSVCDLYVRGNLLQNVVVESC